MNKKYVVRAEEPVLVAHFQGVRLWSAWSLQIVETFRSECFIAIHPLVDMPSLHFYQSAGL